jgi:uncharacterized protein YutE (UPF0331/DUF86 family)
MTTAPIRAEILAEKITYIREMIAAIRLLPLADYESFSTDSRNAAAAEPYLRRALEALFDLGRHILGKAFAAAPVEYKEITLLLTAEGVLPREEGTLLREMAGYRNRMVHFYHEIGVEELYVICRDDITHVEQIVDALLRWLREHPEKVDKSLSIA